MKKLLLFLLGIAAYLAVPQQAAAQTACGGINFTPSLGVTCLLEPTGATYSASAVGLVAASSATDVACLTGGTSKVVRIQIIEVSGTATAISIPVSITKHASADTGGTLATGNALPVAYAHDSNNPTAVATLASWTANPTINDSAPGIIDTQVLGLAATTSAGANPPLKFDLQERNFEQGFILRGPAQQVCVNFNSTSPASSLFNIVFRWTELAQ